MPIKPENKARYPKDWKKIREAVLARAEHCCEGSPKFPDCRVPNYAVRNNETGEFSFDPFATAYWPKKSKIVLTIAHLDHTPENNDLSNLRAWCQRCQLIYDAQHHVTNAAATRALKKAAANPTISMF